ncbi:hypothetical protein HGB25_02055 [Candidatus Saccharibacteria bacterium]|nr:hypothetical protein [Candidatus Saccharibacteria bacterium]
MFGKIFKSKKRLFGLEARDWLLIGLAVSVYVLITIWTITKSSIWFDEAFGAYMVKHFNFIEIARYTASDVHPPMFYWLLKLWSMMFGNSELALRSMSVFFGALAILFGYVLTKRLFNKNAARISLIFMAISPMLVRYGQEARNYTVVVAIALAATYALTLAVNSKKKLPWVVYGALVSLGMWVHYFSAIVWISHWVWRADLVRRVSKKSEFIKKFFSREWILAHLVAVGLYLPWLPFLIIQTTVIQVLGFWIPPVSSSTLVNFATNMIYYRDIGDTVGWMAMGVMAALVFMSVTAVLVYKRLNQKDRESYRLIMSLAFVPMVTLFILSLPPLRPIFVDRYLITSAVAVSIFIGTTLAFGYKYINKKLIVLAGVAIAIMMVVGVTGVWDLGNYNKNTKDTNQARTITELAIKKSSVDEPVIAATPWLFYEAVFYQTNGHPVYFIDTKDYRFGSLAMLQYSDYRKITDIKKFTKDHPTVWYIEWIARNKNPTKPYDNWVQIDQITIHDPVGKRPEYRAVHYRIPNE